VKSFSGLRAFFFGGGGLKFYGNFLGGKDFVTDSLSIAF